MQYILVINAPLKSSINTLMHSLGGTTEPPTGWRPWGRIHFPGAKIFHTSEKSPQSKKSNRQRKKKFKNAIAGRASLFEMVIYTYAQYQLQPASYFPSYSEP